jgi:hypothetical protein
MDWGGGGSHHEGHLHLLRPPQRADSLTCEITGSTSSPGFPNGQQGPGRLVVFFFFFGFLVSHPLHLRLLRATSHTRLRACDHFTSSTLVGGKGRADPSSLHTTLEGPTEWVCECKRDVKSMWIPTWHRMDHVSWSIGLFSKTTSWR